MSNIEIGRATDGRDTSSDIASSVASSALSAPPRNGGGGVPPHSGSGSFKPYYVAHTKIRTLALLDDRDKGSNWSRWWRWRDSPTTARGARLRRLPSLADGRSTTYGLFLPSVGARSLRILTRHDEENYLEILVEVEGFEPSSPGYAQEVSTCLV